MRSEDEQKGDVMDMGLTVKEQETHINFSRGDERAKFIQVILLP